MDSCTYPSCPLCWENGLLKGGKVVGETDQLYAYVFTDDEGVTLYALINPKGHHADMRTLSPLWGAEFGELYSQVLTLMPDAQPHNGYWNKGYVAGQRIMEHWHVRIEPRFPDRPSSNMGLGLLVKTVDEMTSV